MGPSPGPSPRTQAWVRSESADLKILGSDMLCKAPKPDCVGQRSVHDFWNNASRLDHEMIIWRASLYPWMAYEATESGSLISLLAIIRIRIQIISQAGLNLDHGCDSSSLVIWNLLGPIAYILHCFNTNTGKTNKASHVCIHEQQNANQNIVSHCDKLAFFLPFH